MYVPFPPYHLPLGDPRRLVSSPSRVAGCPTNGVVGLEGSCDFSPWCRSRWRTRSPHGRSVGARAAPDPTALVSISGAGDGSLRRRPRGRRPSSRKDGAASSGCPFRCWPPTRWRRRSRRRRAPPPSPGSRRRMRELLPLLSVEGEYPKADEAVGCGSPSVSVSGLACPDPN